MELVDFHFIRPYWLLSIIVLLVVLYSLKKYRVQQSGWQGFIPEHLAQVLISEKKAHKPLSLFIPFIIGIIAIIAMAGPTWKKLPQPVYQVARGSVIIMDLSYSMYSTDISPNRITRARYKAIDLLNEIKEGEIGLIAYAGDAFTISPLTEDVQNIHLLLPALTPDIMPALGSNPLSALDLAKNMLLNAGHITGDIYWFTDGIDNADIDDINQWSENNDYTINILGIGTKTGAPIKLTNGELMKDSTGAIIIPKLNVSPLKQVASKTSGSYVNLTHNNDDINALLSFPLALAQKDENSEQRESQNIGDQWQDMGSYLIFLILPLVLLYFRRGVLVAVLVISLNILPSQPVYANEALESTNSPTDSNTFSNAWNSLWKTQDQQAQEEFNAKAYQEAATKFSDPLWQGSAYYKAGEYEQALEAFKAVDSAQSLYNQGNTLAQLQKLDEAIAAYEEALSINPELEDAQINKDLLERLKNQQQENQEQSDDGSDNSEQQEDSDQQQGSDSNSNSQEQNKSQEQQDDNSESDSSESNSSENSDSNQKSEQESSPQDQSQSSEDNASESDSESNSENNSNTENAETKQTEAVQAEAGDAKGEEEAQASLTAEEIEQAKEQAQKHQQLLNKVTDDPYLLLRNKMQLEYRKRSQTQNPAGVQKPW